MGSLDERLKAYNGKARAPQKLQAASEDYESRSEFFPVHPLSAETLDLPDTVAYNFGDSAAKHNLLFFDLESTGLGAAEQIYPFLIGYARPEDGGAQLTTLFATTPAGEEDILKAFITAAKDVILVSFNGKSFDLPLIMRRAGKYNLKHNLAALPHIDLYHLIRRIYPEKPARLKDAETRLLDFTRADDLGGAEVAQAYFELLRFGDTGLKARILHHNVWDVLTLISLMRRVAAAFRLAREGKVAWAYKIHRDKSADKQQQKQLLTHEKANLDARDYFTLGQIFRAEKNFRKAVRYFISAYRDGHASAIVDAVRSLGRMEKMATAKRLARYALAREDEKVQRQLLRYL